MPTFFIGVAQFVEADDEQDALDKIAEAYKPLKADERDAFAIVAPPDSEWARESYQLFRDHHFNKHPDDRKD